MLQICLNVLDKHQKEILILTLSVVFLAFSAIIFADVTIRHYKAQTFQTVDDCPTKSLGVILGTGPYTRGHISPTLMARLYAGAELYKSGKISRLLISGGAFPSRYYFELPFMKETLVSMGVPSDVIIEDNLGLRTLDSILRTRYVFHENDFIVISQESHVLRALFLASHQSDISCIGFAAPDPPNSPDVDLASFIRVHLSNVKAILDVIFHKSTLLPFDTPQLSPI